MPQVSRAGNRNIALEAAVRSIGQLERSRFDRKKPVAAICHAPWLLIVAGVIRSREATSYHSIGTDMKNAGANWVDREVVVDDGLVTNRSPDDLPAFCGKAIEEFAEGRHAGRQVA